MSASGEPGRVMWIGRLLTDPRSAGQPFTASTCVRVWTEGRAPVADDPFDVIDDPFEDVGADPYELAFAAKAVSSELQGRLGEHRLGCPVRPRKLIGVGRNYRAHAAELGNEVPTRPMLFTKCSSSLLPTLCPVSLYPELERIDMEAELVLVVGKAGLNLERNGSLAHVAGLTLGNDISARDYQKRDKQWTHAKGLDGFAPLGPWVRMLAPNERSMATLSQLRVQGYVDGQLRQDAPISDMVFDLPSLLEAASRRLTLLPGDVIFTGTPEGVTQLKPGMEMVVRAQGMELGELCNPTRAEEALD